MAHHLAATHMRVAELITKIEQHGHTLCRVNFFLFPQLIQCLGHETDLLVWNSQTEQEGHATIPRTQENEIEMGEYSQ
jgi:hypothetical protein